MNINQEKCCQEISEIECPTKILDEELEKIEFKKGSNVLKIALTKKHNRMYKIQIFLNDNVEVRPSTYTGSSSAMSLWNLLKESVK